MKTARDITIYDIAKAVNLSASTVSRALSNHPHINEETRKKIQSVAAEMGYRQNKFASNLRQKHTFTIGVIVPRLDSYFMASALSGIEKITSENGYGLIISQSQESYQKEAACVRTLFNSRVDGLLVSLALNTKDIRHFSILSDKDIPVVFFDRVVDCPTCMSVIIDNFRAGYEVTSHLIDQGCRRIMHLGGNMLRNVYSERYRGYRQALADNKIEFDPDLLIITDMSSLDGKEAGRRILRMKKRPDGLFTSNDTTAVAAIIELEKGGIKIPSDIAVAGFNNEPISTVIKPNLTTVDYPAGETGEIAAASLINKLRNSAQSGLSSIILKHSLIVRESSLRNKTSNSKLSG
jgi:LacI family transcriptional regulator